MRAAKFSELEKQFRAMIKRFNPAYKVEVIHLNISSTFLMHACCKICGGRPAYYFRARKPYIYFDVNSRINTSAMIKSWTKSMSSNWYLKEQPKWFKDIKDFNFWLDHNYFVPTLHRSRNSEVKDKDNIIEMIGCDCGATAWAFNEKSVKNKPEITNRKGRYKFPEKFEH